MTPARIMAAMEASGFRMRTIRVDRLEEVARTLEAQHDEGLLDEGFYLERLAGFEFSPPEGFQDARSVVIVGYADPHVVFTFEWKGKRVPVTVPPTYLHWVEKDALAERTLRDLLEAGGYKLAGARVPKKILAVRSGLARYGRNNITYIPGIGSYYRVAAFFSDMPCREDAWAEPVVMERCEACLACVQACPTGAIDPARFLLRAERCITFWNEKPKGIPFPGWLDSSWHNCLVGCTLCQGVCPENSRGPEVREEGGTFSEDETRMLLEGRHAGDLPDGLVERLEKADLLPTLDTLPRNLGMLLESARPQS